MSVRQYIGARYVTKVYENTLDPSSAEWQASVNYEPLTMVTYNNGSYLSKKQVPASVGNPASNPTYWAQTGFYNGQISYLQSEIDAINAELNKEMKVACIGDSYGMKIINNWCNFLKTYLGLDSDHFINKCTGSSGFVGNTGVKTFLQQLQEIADPETYTHVIIVGGFNDGYDANGAAASVSDLQTAINACGTYIKNNFTNAKTYLGFAANICNLNDPTTAATMRSQMISCRNAYSWFGAQQGWAVMDSMQYILHDVSYLDTSDITYGCVFHPNSTGGQLLARCIISYMNGGNFSISNSNYVSFSADTGVSFTGTMYESLNNNVVKLYSGTIQIVFTTPVASPATTPIALGTCTHSRLFPGVGTSASLTPAITINAKATINSNDTTIPVTLIFDGNSLSIWAQVPATYTTAISNISILPFCFSSDTLLN